MDRKILVYGYGNPGRQDDGLGVALVEELEQWVATEKIPGLDFDSNYQLNAEDALAGFGCGDHGAFFAASRETASGETAGRFAPYVPPPTAG